MPTSRKIFEKARIGVADGTDRVQRAVDHTADACLGALEGAEAGAIKMENALGEAKEKVAGAVGGAIRGTVEGLPLRAEAFLRRLARLMEERLPPPLDSLSVPLDNIATLVGGYSLRLRETVTRLRPAPPPAAKAQAA